MSKRILGLVMDHQPEQPPADVSGQAESGKYAVHKTFAWGGLFGLLTKTEEAEERFAEPVANIPDEKEPGKTL